MRMKVVVDKIEPNSGGEFLAFRAVCKDGSYPADGSDEDNTFAKWTPNASILMQVNNPALIGVHKPGKKFYVDFTPAD